MPCGYCSEIGHTMRHCNSAAAQRLLADYRGTCMTPRTDEELNRFLSSFTSDMLSLIMYSYGASSVSVNRSAKEQFIRERILQARGVGNPPPPPPVVRQQVVHQIPRSPVGPPPLQAVHRVQPVRETMAEYKARMQLEANTLFDAVCVSAYRITRYTSDNAIGFGEMIEMLSVCLIAETRNSMPDSIFIMKLTIKKFHLPRAIAPTIKQFFLNSIYREHRRVSEITIAGLRAQGLLPPAQQQQVFVPHKPQFAAIQFFHIIDADEAEDYFCGVCSDEFTKETLPTLGCDHTLCAECITGLIKARSKSCIKCPYCREEVKQISVGDEVIRNRIYTLVTAEIEKK